MATDMELDRQDLAVIVRENSKYRQSSFGRFQSINPDLLDELPLVTSFTDDTVGEIHIIRDSGVNSARFHNFSLLQLLSNSQTKCKFNYVPNLNHPANFTVFSINQNGIFASAQVSVPRKSVFEIFNVCSVPGNVRGTGTVFMKKLVNYISSITKKGTKRKVWLGVSIDNPFFIQATRTYINVGFRRPHVALESPSGMSNNNIPFIGLFMDINNRIEQSVVDELKQSLKQYVITLRNSITENPNRTWANIGIQNPGNPGMGFIKHHIFNTEVEIGGSLFFEDEKYTMFEDILKGFKLKAIKSRAGDPNNFTINIPLDKANFHTHPAICKEKYGCSLGWPSGPDIQVLLSQAPKGLNVHFVFTFDGTYIIQTSNKYREFISQVGTNHRDVVEFINSVFIIFASLEQFRLSNIKNVSENTLINTWLMVANNFTVDNMINLIELSLETASKGQLFIDGERGYPNVWGALPNTFIDKTQVKIGLRKLNSMMGQIGLVTTSLFMVSHFLLEEVPFTTIIYPSQAFYNKNFPSESNSIDNGPQITLSGSGGVKNKSFLLKDKKKNKKKKEK